MTDDQIRAEFERMIAEEVHRDHVEFEHHTDLMTDSIRLLLASGFTGVEVIDNGDGTRSITIPEVLMIGVLKAMSAYTELAGMSLDADEMGAAMVLVDPITDTDTLRGLAINQALITMAFIMDDERRGKING